MGRENHDEEKVTGIPAGSSIRRGSSGRSSGIPPGSSVRRSGGGGGSGIPTGSNIKKKKRKGGGIPTGSSIRKGGSGGSRSGIPPGSKGEEFDEVQGKDWSEWNSRRKTKNSTRRNPVSGIPQGSSVAANGFPHRRTAAGVPPGASTLKGRGRKRVVRGVPGGGKDDAVAVERKDAAGPVEVVDDQKGIVEAFVSVTGVKDNVDDVILPGAYEKTLQERTPKGVWSHAWEHPVSKTLDIREMLPGDPDLPETLADGTKWPNDAGALWVKTQFNLDSDRGREAYSMVKFFGDDGSWSIGYRVPKNGATKDEKSGIRRIKELNLYEYSPVLHGAAPLAKTRSVKSLDEAWAALEDAGYEVDLDDSKLDFDPDGLTDDEIKALVMAHDVVGAYLDEIIGVKDVAVEDDAEQDEEIGWLADELAEVLDADDYAELLGYAAAFDEACAYGDEADAEVAIDEFMDVLDAEIEADPEIAGLSDLIGAVLDDRYPEGADDELDEGDEDEYEEFEDEYEEFEDEADPEDDGDEADESEETDDSGYLEGDADEFEAEGEADAEAEPVGEADAGDAGDAGDIGKFDTSFYDRGEVKSPNAKERRQAASSGAAMSDGSYPIRNQEELRKAHKLRNNGNADSSSVNAHIKKRARALGVSPPGGDDKKKSLADIRWDADDVVDSVVGAISWEDAGV